MINISNYFRGDENEEDEIVFQPGQPAPFGFVTGGHIFTQNVIQS